MPEVRCLSDLPFRLGCCHGRESRDRGEQEVAKNTGDEGTEGNICFGTVEQGQEQICYDLIHSAGFGSATNGHTADHEKDLRVGDATKALLIEQRESRQEGKGCNHEHHPAGIYLMDLVGNQREEQ